MHHTGQTGELPAHKQPALVRSCCRRLRVSGVPFFLIQSGDSKAYALSGARSMLGGAWSLGRAAVQLCVLCL